MSLGKLRPIVLRAEGFRGICDECEIKFDHHMTLLSAPNGSGKTSILGAIEWALFSKLQYQPSENLTNDELVNIRHPSQRAVVTVELEGDDGIASVTRSKRIGKMAQDVVLRLPDGTVVSGPEAETATYRLLGLTFDDFYRAIYLHQESVRGLLTEEPARRNEALDRLFGVDKLRSMLKGMTTKSVRDAQHELDAERTRATDKLVGAVRQVEEQRRRALADAAKDS